MSPGAPAYTKDRVFKQDANVRVAGRVDVTQTGRGRLALCKGGAGLLYARRGKRHSLIAQLVEQSTVNRSVAGSSPAQGAKIGSRLSESSVAPSVANQMFLTAQNLLVNGSPAKEEKPIGPAIDVQCEDLMPLYSYSCQNCKADFEILVRSTDVPACPTCGSDQLQQHVAKVCNEIKYPAIARSWRQRAAREGDLSNFSKQEIGAK